MQINKKNDNRGFKCILHEISDIPNGVTINTKVLGGDAVLEGTPIAKGENGLYEVVKTARIAEKVTASATTIKISKRSNFRVGDYVSDGKGNAQAITAIDRDNEAYDSITLESALSATIEVGVVVYESTSGSTELKYKPMAINGANYSIVKGEDLVTNALIRCDIREDIAPAVNETIKNALPLVAYI